MNKMPLKFFTSVVAILFLVPVSICQSSETSGWQTIQEDGLVTFRLPKGFIKTGMTGVEHSLGEYYEGNIRFLFISGNTNSYAYDVRRQPEMKDYKEIETKIDGKQANIRTFYQIENGQRMYRAELNIGDWANAKVELYMELESKNPADLKMAKKIFYSVDFP